MVRRVRRRVHWPAFVSLWGVLLKIRIFALAKELGLDSKELIEYAAQAGVEVKNSALASISPEERDLVLAHMKTAKSAPGAVAARDEGPSPARRDVGQERG
jgi:translation initiation factor IF-2